jgi:hypothetical protein
MMKIPIADDSPTNRAGLSRCAPLFDPEHIRSMVTKLYKAGLRREAGAICNAYASKIWREGVS